MQRVFPRRATALPRKVEGTLSLPPSLSLSAVMSQKFTFLVPSPYTLSALTLDADPQIRGISRQCLHFLPAGQAVADKFLGELCYQWGWPAGTPAIWKVPPWESRDFKMAAAEQQRRSTD